MPKSPVKKSFFSKDVSIERDGRTITFTLAEQNALVSQGNYWHAAGQPSTWLAVTTFCAVRTQHELDDESALELARLALGVERGALIDLIRWNERYMNWHDGCDYPPVLDPKIE